VSNDPTAPLLKVRDLRVAYKTDHGLQDVVHGVDFDVYPGEAVGIVGESGSGKSTVLLAAARLLPSNARISNGSVQLDGQDLATLDQRTLRTVHGPRIGMLYQDSLRALNPVMKVGDQVSEMLRAHGYVGDRDEKVVDLFRSVGISDPEGRVSQFPHQLSGGMRQRVMTALSLALSPQLLLADEPTTALDVTIQAQILDLLRHSAVEHGTATVIVSHDLGVIANLCNRVIVVYAGRVVEQGPTDAVFADPQHPYTAALLRAVPRVDTGLHRLPFIEGQPPEPEAMPAGCSFEPRCPVSISDCSTAVPPLRSFGPDRQFACIRDQVADSVAVALTASVETGAESPQLNESDDSLVVIRGLTRSFKIGRGRNRPQLRAVDGVDLEIRRGEFLGLVGESGCGKSTLGRLLVGLDKADEGEVIFNQVSASAGNNRSPRQMRKFSQMVFQDPRSSLNRRMSVAEHLEEALVNAGVERSGRHKRLLELLDQVGLPVSALTRLPHEFSGGQAQRIAIARALAVRPSLIVADEAVSSLDVSVKGQIVNLLRDLQQELGLTVLFISHDLGVVRNVSDRVAVMYLGRIIELRKTDELFVSPHHPYTQALISAVPVPDPVVERRRERITLQGDVPNPSDPPSGCRFHPRCPVGPLKNPDRHICREESPELDLDGSAAACHFASDFAAEQAHGS